MNKGRLGNSFIVLLTLVGVMACSQDEDKAVPPAGEAKAEAPVQAEAAKPAPAAAETEPMVYFIAPAHEATLKSPVRVKFGLIGMAVAPAGSDMPNSGHHHLLINATALPAAGQPIPSDAQHMHFGKGQTEAMVELPPGTHTLQLIVGDKNHVPHNPPVVSHKITVTVEE